MTTLEFVSGRQWLLKLPPIYRYIEAEFVEQFFATGRLKLTTYAACKKHENAVRRDEGEGHCNYELLHGDYSTSGFHNVGKWSYMLCASMLESPKLLERFGAGNCIRIDNILAFADAVSRRVNGFEIGKFGPCIYRPQRLISKDVVALGPDPAKLFQELPGKSEEEVEKTFTDFNRQFGAAVNGQLDQEPYFIKEDRFADEAEFRIVWEVPYEVTEPIFIDCPEAVQFCAPAMPLPDGAPRSPPPVNKSPGAFVSGLSPKGAKRRLEAIDALDEKGGDPRDV